MQTGKALIWRKKIVIPTYMAGKAETLPVFYKLRNNQGTRGGIYPYRMTDKLSFHTVEREYDAIHLENEYIRVTVLPELGGRIYEGYDKVNNYHFVYKNNVIKPALIGLCGTWISGGIEFNWPQHHRPTTFMPVECMIEEDADGAVTAWLGETEPMYGLKATLGISISPGKSYITAKIRLFNGTRLSQTFHWWANLAVHANDGYRLIFPPDIDSVTFHNKTDVSHFPYVSGSFGGADFGQGVDVREYRNILPSSSFFAINSVYSFMAGYDDNAGKGTVHVADRFIAPGKKFFTWGRAGYGQAWQKNLTDHDGDYLEIMTGCFTDNQPDFAFLAPYETKSFVQRWYPLCGLPGLKNATDEAAVSITEDAGAIRVAVNVTARHESAALCVSIDGECLFQTSFPAIPCNAYEFFIKLPPGKNAGDVSCSLLDQDGRLLVHYLRGPMYFDGKEKPVARKPAETPERIGSCEELWLNGLHLEQYKHPFLDPDPYYLEAIRRDPADVRCNTAMAARMYRRGRYESALPYLSQAALRLTGRNPNPYDTEAFYLLGITRLALGKHSDALSALKMAAWTYAFAAPALQAAAEIECRQESYCQALADLDLSLQSNRVNQRALGLKAAVLLRLGRGKEAERICYEALEYDRMDMAARFLLTQCEGQGDSEELVSVLGRKTSVYLNLAEPFLSAGLYQEALRALELCPVRTQMICYYLAYSHHMLGDALHESDNLSLAGAALEDDVFPSRECDFIVLTHAAGASDGNAYYLLGCMQYARGNGSEAVSLWREAVALVPEKAAAHRCFAQALFETGMDRAGALNEMETAFRLDQGSRMLFELYQVKKVNGMHPQQGLLLLESRLGLVFEREDLLQQYIRCLAQCGKLEEAERILAGHSFYTYEGGEGALPRMHAFVHLSLGSKALDDGDLPKALAYYMKALDYPANYHEGRRHNAKESHIYYHIAFAHRALGNREAAVENLRLAAAMGRDAVESEFYCGLAVRALGDAAGAEAIFTSLVIQGKEMSAQSHPGYFEGFPAALPFEQDPVRMMKQRGYTAWLYGLAGLGKTEDANALLAAMREQTLDTLWPEYILGGSWEVQFL